MKAIKYLALFCVLYSLLVFCSNEKTKVGETCGTIVNSTTNTSGRYSKTRYYFSVDALHGKEVVEVDMDSFLSYKIGDSICVPRYKENPKWMKWLFLISLLIFLIIPSK